MDVGNLLHVKELAVAEFHGSTPILPLPFPFASKCLHHGCLDPSLYCRRATLLFRRSTLGFRGSTLASIGVDLVLVEIIGRIFHGTSPRLAQKCHGTTPCGADCRALPIDFATRLHPMPRNYTWFPRNYTDFHRTTPCRVRL